MRPSRSGSVSAVAIWLAAWLLACSYTSDALLPTAAAPGSDTGLAGGKFLVAKSKLRDPNFSKTVILLLNYGVSGATGLIINRRSDVDLAELLPELKRSEVRDDPVYFGGPVDGGRLFLLVRSKVMRAEASRVIDEVWFSHSGELLQSLLDDDAAPELRVYVGYAGWAPGQLDAEVERGDWDVVSATVDEVFADRPGDLWHRLSPPDPTQVASARRNY